MIRFEITSSLDYRIKLHEIGIETRPRIAFDGAERRSVSFFFPMFSLSPSIETEERNNYIDAHENE